MLVPRIRFDRSSQPSKSWKIQASRGNEKNGLKIYSLECFTRSNLANMLGSTIGGFVALLVGLTAFLRLIIVFIALSALVVDQWVNLFEYPHSLAARLYDRSSCESSSCRSCCAKNSRSARENPLCFASLGDKPSSAQSALYFSLFAFSSLESCLLIAVKLILTYLE